MSTNDDIRLQSVTLGAVSINRGGDRGGEWVTFQADPISTTAEGPGGGVSSRNTRRNGLLTITVREQDAACLQLEQINSAWQVASASPVPAVSQNANLALAGRLSRPSRYPRLITWGSAAPVDQPQHAAGEGVGAVKSYAFRCYDIAEIP